MNKEIQNQGYKNRLTINKSMISLNTRPFSSAFADNIR